MRVFRDFGGLKVQLVRPPAYVCFYPSRAESGGETVEHPISSTQCPGRVDAFNDQGVFIERRPEREIANWFFQSCQ